MENTGTNQTQMGEGKKVPGIEELIKAESDVAEVGQEIGGDPNLRTIKRWLANRSYSEKLSGVLMMELAQKESEFGKPDNSIGNDLIQQWRKAVIEMSGDSNYLETADTDEAAVTAATAMMIPWRT